MVARDPLELARKQAALDACLRKFSSLGVAFSGGVDSTVLLAAARQALGSRVIAFTARSEIHPSGEMQTALEIARRIGAQHIVFPTGEMADPIFMANPRDRCYHCKKNLFEAMRIQAEQAGVHSLAHGANTDDLSDFRPGFKAAREMGVAAPLIEAGFSKADIRESAKSWGLPNWDRPAMACLATRIPYGMRILSSDLIRIDQAEDFIRSLGAVQCRVRHHGDLARIEISPHQLTHFSAERIRDAVVHRLRELGYVHICLDLEGYSSGKMNRGSFIP